MNIRDQAIDCNVKLYAYRKSRDGMIVSFVVHPQEVPNKLQTDPIGTSYMLALVEVDDATGQPKGGDAHGDTTTTVDIAPRPQTPEGGARKRDWDEISYAEQAGIRCNEPAFWKFLEDDYKEQSWAGWPFTNSDNAAMFIRIICDVRTRADIHRGTPPGDTWARIDSRYRTARALELCT